MFALDHADTKDLHSFLAGLPVGDEVNEIIVPARLDPLTIHRDALSIRSGERSHRIATLLTASLPGARRSRSRL